MSFRRRYRSALVFGIGGATLGVGLFIGCKAGQATGSGGFDSGSGAAAQSGTMATAMQTGAGASGSTSAASTAAQFMSTTGAGDAPSDVPMNPCGTQCGSTELCDGVHKGIDDNCDGQVDENCPCEPGQAESCFKGDPSYLNTPGCFPGTQICTELGKWGPCIGGSHANDNPPCFATQVGCHPITALPFQTVDLSTGLGTFGQGGTNDQYMLDCPMGVSPCPAPNASGSVQVLVSGEYTVTFTETVAGQPKTCQYPLYVGARGLRVELSWDFPTSGGSDDFDLHMHRPGTTTPWNISGQSADDCGYGNCKVISTSPPFDTGDATAPNWFPTTMAMPPNSPVSWFLDPVMTNNTCYYAPRMAGQDWIDAAMGCHSPRLDIDDITCNPSITDVNDPEFCVPENVNIDYPPLNTWIRVGVHLYPGTTSFTGQSHPDVKIYCDAALAGELGAHGFYTPEAPVTFYGAQSGSNPSSVATFWPVADVFIQQDQCSKTCVVKPIYANAASKLPLFEANQQPLSAPPFGPPSPANP